MSRSRSTKGPYRAPTEQEILAAARGQWRNVTYFKEQDMTDFQYTDSLRAINSSAVKAAYYNTHDKTLVVVMRSNGNAYRYDGVPSWVWTDFKGSSSKGTSFATRIKPSYGPSKFLGIGSRLKFAEYGVSAPSMASPRYPLTVASPPVGAGRRPVGVGVPKALVDNTTSSSVEAFPVSRKHEVSFVIEGARDERVYNVQTDSVDSAVSALSDATDALGLKVKVKRVTVNFE